MPRQKILAAMLLACGYAALAACDSGDDPIFRDGAQPTRPGEPATPPLPPGNPPGALPNGAQGDAAAPTRAGETRLAADATVLARAEVRPVSGGPPENQARGTVTFERAANGGIVVHAALTGLAVGPHGFHVHENGDCGGMKAEAAGGHWNPKSTQHGGLDKPAAQRHAGDLGNVTANDRGELDVSVESDALLENGRLGVVGRAIVVHTGPDDLRSQPSGQSGDPIACGVIRAVAATPGA
jgi:Cu-Zn family superoxide dismutase